MKYLNIKIVYVILLTMLTFGCNDDDDPKGDLSPRATFTASATFATEGSEITFTDSSTNTPTAWSWDMPGATPNTSTDQNPTAVYNTEGIYDVTLTITNAYGTDSVTFENYIEIGSSEIPPQVELNFENNLINEGNLGIDASTTGTPAYGTRTDGGNTYLFNGVDNQLKIVGYAGISGNKERTMALWMKPDATGYDSGIMNWGADGTGSRWSFKYNTSGGLRIEWQGGGMNSIGLGLDDGNWHHVAVTFAGSDTVTLYIDGVADNSTTTSIINTGNSGELDVEIGTYRDNQFPYKGEMDGVRIYDLALTAEDIAGLMTN